MAALKETGILQSVTSMDDGVSSGAESGGGDTTTSPKPAPGGAHNVNVLAGFKNVQESIRQQQSKVTKNLKDFGLIKEQAGHNAAAAHTASPYTDTAGASTPRSPVASATSPGSLALVGSTDFGGGSPDTQSRTVVIATKDG